MALASLDKKVEKFYDQRYMSMLFPPVWIGWRRYGRLKVVKAFEHVLEEQLGFGNITEETYNNIVTEINGLITQMTSRLYSRKSLIESRSIITDFRKKLAENSKISTYLTYAQSKQYLKKANASPQQNIAKEVL